jgi:hypothetical protein
VSVQQTSDPNWFRIAQGNQGKYSNYIAVLAGVFAHKNFANVNTALRVKLVFLVCSVMLNQLFVRFLHSLITIIRLRHKLQGFLPEGEGSVRLSSLSLLVQIICFLYSNRIFLFYKASYLNKEVNCTEPSPSVRFPCKLALPYSHGPL